MNAGADTRSRAAWLAALTVSALLTALACYLAWPAPASTGAEVASQLREDGSADIPESRLVFTRVFTAERSGALASAAKGETVVSPWEQQGFTRAAEQVAEGRCLMFQGIRGPSGILFRAWGSYDAVPVGDGTVPCE